MTKVCNRCVMDNINNLRITFDSDGFCNYCSEFLNLTKGSKSNIYNDNIDGFLKKIKIAGKNKKYDCIVGVSGGVDSSWVLVQAVKFGLRPLAVHMDNGWNSELAQNNINNLVKSLNIDLYTHVINWQEYRNLMDAFFKADVVDVELLYDNAMYAVNYNLARKFGVKYILSGMNKSTEGLKIPDNWNWFKFDKKNIKHIGKKFGNIKIDTFPSFGTFDFIKATFFSKIIWESFLDYIDFNKNDALNELVKNYNYIPYEFKHAESVFTRFYQGYLLVKKFQIDKRKVHLSNLIITNQLKRNEALEILKLDTYDKHNIDADIKYFLKKMKWSLNDLNDYLARPEVKHDFYKSERKSYFKLLNFYKSFLSLFKLR
jgi:N-acetyl sugar amidotransferase